MKRNLKIAGVLALIAVICALAIAGMNMVTSGIIKANNDKTELKTCQAIFSSYDKDKSEEMTSSNEAITKKVLAKDSNGNELGYLYTVTGKNAYGAITIMVAVKDDKVLQVEFLENGQSFASTVTSHVQNSYPSSPDDSLHVGAYKKEEASNIGSLSSSEIDGIDTACGATYGAKLVKELVNIALQDAKGGK